MTPSKLQIIENKANIAKDQTMRSPIHLFTVEEYLEIEKSGEIRHDYLGLTLSMSEIYEDVINI